MPPSPRVLQSPRRIEDELGANSEPRRRLHSPQRLPQGFGDWDGPPAPPTLRASKGNVSQMGLRGEELIPALMCKRNGCSYGAVSHGSPYFDGGYGGR